MLFRSLHTVHNLTIYIDLHRRRELRWSIYSLYWYVFFFSSFAPLPSPFRPSCLASPSLSRDSQKMTNAYANSKRSPGPLPRTTSDGYRDRKRLDRRANAVPRIHRVCSQDGVVQGRVGSEFSFSTLFHSSFYERREELISILPDYRLTRRAGTKWSSAKRNSIKLLWNQLTLVFVKKSWVSSCSRLIESTRFHE